MKLRIILRIAAAVTMLSAVGGSAAAQSPLTSARPLGMANALRGEATGDAALSLNPSGLLLPRVLADPDESNAGKVWEFLGSYDFARRIDAHQLHVAITDTTSDLNLGGGIYYTYLSSEPASGITTSGHEAGLALALPLSYVLLGTTVKYFRLASRGAALPGEVMTSGFTVDVGATVLIGRAIHVGLVGYNLVDLDTPRAPRGFGGGVAFTPVRELRMDLDAVYDFRSADRTRGDVLHLMAGGEYDLERFGIRAGGGRRGDTKNGFLAAGVSLYSAQIGALDVGLQQDITGSLKETIVGVSARLLWAGALPPLE